MSEKYENKLGSNNGARGGVERGHDSFHSVLFYLIKTLSALVVVLGPRASRTGANDQIVIRNLTRGWPRGLLSLHP